MALKKCATCNVMIDASEGKDYCSNCLMENFNQFSEDQQEAIYIRVRQYLHENPKTPKTTVANEMNISVKVIDKWIREGKIEEVEGMMVGSIEKKQATCAKCGKKIEKGQLMCEVCKKEFSPNKQQGEGITVGFRSNAGKG